ncbi:hypothetical protein [Brachybacterium sp. FME24]|uniref:hypothetical protein n=1 Tax=Brachybacterium sp. FME24 TaxID=2742605 RepID=UPI00186786A2|nr:hypothetical protein [Brachybacterium sp. FME24]
MSQAQDTTHEQAGKLERRAARLDDPMFEKYRSPRPRRRLAVAMIALLAVEAIIVVLPGIGAIPIWAFLAAMAVLIIVFVVVLGMLKASTRGVEELPEEVLDERQAQIRGRVYSGAYRVVSVMAIVLAAFVLVTVAVGWAVPEFLAIGIAVVAYQLVIIAPTLVAALQHDA